MSKIRSHHEIAIASIHVFSDDGRLDLAELEKLLALALRDGAVDEDEKRVLANILTRAERDGVDEAVLTRIDQARQQHGLSD
jgi:LDH2 family malate/lactate/ureidoglycolate dehydrogenase